MSPTIKYSQAIANLEDALQEYVERYGITKKASEAFRQLEANKAVSPAEITCWAERHDSQAKGRCRCELERRDVVQVVG